MSTRSHWLRWVQLRTARNTGKIDVERQLYDAAGVEDPTSLERLQESYVLLPYASEYWLSHSSAFTEQNTKAWRMWNDLLLAESSFAQTPWTFDEWTCRTHSIIRWVFENHHCALLRHIESSSTNALSSRDRRIFFVNSARQGRSQFVDVLIDLGKIRDTDLETALQAAAGGGHRDIVDRLLVAKADVNAPAPAGYASRIALQAESGGRYLDVMEPLVVDNGGLTALQEAAEGGHLDVVERLLAAKADVNTPPTGYGLIALQAAAEDGHLEIVERLLAARADVNAPAGFNGRTALQAGQ